MDMTSQISAREIAGFPVMKIVRCVCVCVCVLPSCLSLTMRKVASRFCTADGVNIL
jgi:hypothetical protein